MAERHEAEARRRKRIQVIGAAVAATVVVGGITAGAVALSGSGKQPKGKAVTVADGPASGSPVAADGSSAPASPSGSASAGVSASPSLSASARPSASASRGGSASAAPGQVSAAPGAPVPAPPGAPGVPDSPHGEIKNVHSGMALEIENSRTDNGAAADQWTYNPSNQTMNWYLHWVGDSWELRNAHSNLCLQIPDSPAGPAGNGVHADQWTCNGSPGQHWDLRPGVGGGQQVVNHRSGDCLEVENSQKTNGAVIQQWQCYQFDDHSWIVP